METREDYKDHKARSIGVYVDRSFCYSFEVLMKNEDDIKGIEHFFNPYKIREIEKETGKPVKLTVDPVPISHKEIRAIIKHGKKEFHGCCRRYSFSGKIEKSIGNNMFESYEVKINVSPIEEGDMDGIEPFFTAYKN